MKMLIYTDNHFCSNSSIVRSRGEKYSLRIENQLKSLNWAEELSITEKCDTVVCLGDFFDKSVLNDEELTAIKEIHWSCLPHYFIVGNHESSINGLEFNSTKALERPNFTVVNKFGSVFEEFDDGHFNQITFLPYIIESDREPLIEYLEKRECTHNHIVLSHNDIKGIQMGPIVSKDGFNVSEIESECNLFLNGHLHNGTKFCKNGYNLGNLTGQNFGEDAFRYSHNVLILDTDSLEMKFIENPYAFNFYKIDILSKEDIDKLSELKQNSIVSIKCVDTVVDAVKQIITNNSNIIINKITVVRSQTDTSSEYNIEDLSVDHLVKFVEFCKERINNTDVLEQELNEVCK